MDFSNIFRIVNLAVGAVMVLGGIVKFFGIEHYSQVIIGCYVILFGLATAGLEFQIPSYISRYASFYFSFLGRGIFYVFVGSILLGDGAAYNIIAGVMVGVVGVGYIVLEFLPSIEPPSNMRDAADGGWGAEQI